MLSSFSVSIMSVRVHFTTLGIPSLRIVTDDEEGESKVLGKVLV